jgi:hypothetical protein
MIWYIWDIIICANSIFIFVPNHFRSVFRFDLFLCSKMISEIVYNKVNVSILLKLSQASELEIANLPFIDQQHCYV